MEWAVLTWNEPAIQFYNKLGAGSLDDWRVFRLNERWDWAFGGVVIGTEMRIRCHVEHSRDIPSHYLKLAQRDPSTSLGMTEE
jgi:hypothetical protein